MYMIDGYEAGAIIVFVGEDVPPREDEPGHTVHMETCRVTSDGRVWVSSDPTLLEDRWLVIE